ncbi:MAG: Crp/Fnr family transcriptional regulator [Usitatibacter sp.]
MAPNDLSKTNRILASLPRKDRESVLAGCSPVELSLGEVLAEPGDSIGHVHFPTRSFISLTAPMGRSSIDVALVGDEGMAGLPLALGVGISNVRVLVQGAGPALRMTATRFRTELGRNGALRKALGRYAFVSMSQLGQAAGCNRFHLVEARLARWLLMTGDRAHSPSFYITHEFLALMLGVRRVGITKAASALQERGLIRYSRGNLTILDRDGLEAASCPCYRADLTVYGQMFG